MTTEDNAAEAAELAAKLNALDKEVAEVVNLYDNLVERRRELRSRIVQHSRENPAVDARFFMRLLRDLES